MLSGLLSFAVFGIVASLIDIVDRALEIVCKGTRSRSLPSGFWQSATYITSNSTRRLVYFASCTNRRNSSKQGRPSLSRRGRPRSTLALQDFFWNREMVATQHVEVLVT